MPARWLLLEITAYVELASPMIRKLQVILPELLIVTLYFTETMGGLTLVIAVLCFGSRVLHLVLQTRQKDVICGVLSPILSVLRGPR